MYSAFAAAVTGLAAYTWCHWREPSTLMEMFILLVGVPSGLNLHALHYGVDTSGLLMGLYVTLIYFSTLTISIVAYRISPFHPLSRYPGPFIAKVTRFWALYKVLEGKQYECYHRLHETYGDVIRTGPNHLLIRNVKAIPVILGPESPHNRWVKGRRYQTTTLPGSSGSLITLRTTPEHSARRRIWNNGFTPSALKGYEPMIYRRASQLLSRLQSHDKETVNLSAWLSYFSMDFMGDLAFDSEFHFMEEGRDYIGLQNILEKGAMLQEAFGIIPWVQPILRVLPQSPGIKKMYDTGRHHITKRQKEGSSTKDIFFHLLDEGGSSGHEQLSLATLAQEAVLALVAGSDTTASALTHTFYYLLSNPDVFIRLRNEIDEVMPADVQFPDTAILANMPFLQAVIQETLRLQPVIPSGVQRVAPSPRDVVVFDDIVVPAHTTIQIPTWSLHRDPRYFSPKPELFDPDRWLAKQNECTKKDYCHNVDAWIPFSYGPTNCIGKKLAMMELKVVVSTLVRSLDFEFASKWDSQEWNKNLKDHFLLIRGELPVVVCRRTSA